MASTPSPAPRGEQTTRKRRDRWWLLLLFLAISLLLHVGIGWEGRGWHIIDTGHPTLATPSPGEIEVAFDAPTAPSHAAPSAIIPPKAPPVVKPPPRVKVARPHAPQRHVAPPKLATKQPTVPRHDRPVPIVKAAPTKPPPRTTPEALPTTRQGSSHPALAIPALVASTRPTANVAAITPHAAAPLPAGVAEAPIAAPALPPVLGTDKPRVALGPQTHLRAPIARNPDGEIATPVAADHPADHPAAGTPATTVGAPIAGPSTRLGLTRGIPFGSQTGLSGLTPGEGVGPDGQPKGVISGYDSNGVFHLKLGRPTAASLGLTPAHIVYLLDVSGSMIEDNKLGLAKEALRNAVKELLPDDSFLFITLADHPHAYGDSLHKASAFNISTQEENVDILQPNGGTNVSDALDLALGMTGVTHIFLISDGEPNLGITNYDELLKHLRTVNAGAAVHISTFALGPGEEFQGVQLLKKIAEQNGGEYRYINDKNSFEK